VTPSLDIVIVSFNTRADLAACLASLQATPPSRTSHVIVVDNGSTDGSVEAVRRGWPGVQVLALDRNAGFAAANNVGLRAATAPLTLLLNSDTIVPDGAIDALVARLEATGAVAAGPALVDSQGRPEVSFGRMLSPWSEVVQLVRTRLASRDGTLARRYVARLVSKERIVDWASGACLLVRREAALAAGLFDERFFMYEEDVDFCAALRSRRGRILFTPGVRVVHLRGRSVRAAGQAPTGHYDRSHLAFYEKHAPGWVPVLRLWQRLRRRKGTGLASAS
jgi:hypothetical protein